MRGDPEEEFHTDDVGVDDPICKTEEERIADCVEKYGLSQDQVKKFKISFDLLDKDGNGTLHTEELGNAMHFWGQQPTSANLQALINKYDENGNGTIEFPEYLTMMSQQIQQTKTEQAMIDSIQKSKDVPQNGYLPKDILKEALDELGEDCQCSDDEFDKMSQLVETNAKGDLNYSQFVKALARKNFV